MTAHEDFVTALVAQLPGLRRYAVALVGNAALADDLVQDSIERALRQSTQLRELERLPMWLRRILHNRYIDEIRRNRGKGKEQDIADMADRLELSTPAADGMGPRDFLRAIGMLSIEHRQILLLVSLDDLGYREIAEELGVPIGTVMSRLARAREKLRSLMQNEPEANVIQLAARRQPETMSDNPQELELHAYLDGELDAEHALAFEVSDADRSDTGAACCGVPADIDMLKRRLRAVGRPARSRQWIALAKSTPVRDAIDWRMVGAIRSGPGVECDRSDSSYWERQPAGSTISLRRCSMTTIWRKPMK